MAHPDTADVSITHEYVDANGLRFHVASAGEGDRLALCLHGFPECWYSWRYQLPLLARLGYLAWAPDLRGYGDTSRPSRVRDYCMEPLMDDVAGLIDASGAKETLLIAHDWGGAIAWSFAMHGSRPLDRLIVMNLPHPGAMQKAFSFRQLLRSWYVLFFQLPGLPEWVLSRGDYRAIGEAFRGMAIDKSRFPEEVLRVYRENAAKPGALTAMINYYRGLLRGGSARRLRELGTPVIDVPTLIIWGEEDRALGKELTYGTDAFVSDLEIQYLPGVSHWVQQEAPEKVNALMAEWLERKG